MADAPDFEPELVKRLKALEATERKFACPWEPGKVDCAQMAIFHLRQFKWKLPKIEPYSTIEQGKERLARLGAATMADVLDQIGLRRIAPASALLGDILCMPGEGPFGAIGALGLAIGNGAMKIFHEDHEGLVSFRASIIPAAWSVVP